MATKTVNPSFAEISRANDDPPTALMEAPRPQDAPPTSIDATTPMSIIASALAAGKVDTDQLSKLMDLQERWERNRAAESFAQALAKFQSKCPPIHKGRSGAHGAKFAGFDDIMAMIRPVLAECGLSVSFDTESTDGKSIAATCIVKHGIHEHRTKFVCPVATDLKANASQQYGSALSYVKRYSMCAALNIVVTDEDVDAGNLDAEPITDEQRAELFRLLTETKSDTTKFMAWLGVEQLADITQGKQYDKALAAVRAKMKEQGR